MSSFVSLNLNLAHVGQPSLHLARIGDEVMSAGTRHFHTEELGSFLGVFAHLSKNIRLGCEFTNIRKRVLHEGRIHRDDRGSLLLRRTETKHRPNVRSTNKACGGNDNDRTSCKNALQPHTDLTDRKRTDGK